MAKRSAQRLSRDGLRNEEMAAISVSWLASDQRRPGGGYRPGVSIGCGSRHLGVMAYKSSAAGSIIENDVKQRHRLWQSAAA
jgi:hypothetical protein